MIRTSYIHEDEQQHVFRVDRTAMTSEELFAAERDAIFARCWLYLGHTSEVRAVGDFVRRDIAGQPLFFTRGKDERVRAFFRPAPRRVWWQ